MPVQEFALVVVDLEQRVLDLARFFSSANQEEWKSFLLNSLVAAASDDAPPLATKICK